MTNKLRIYQEHFERQYIDSTREFYKLHGSDYMTENGVQNYMRYVSQLLHVLVYVHVCIVPYTNL